MKKILRTKDTIEIFGTVLEPGDDVLIHAALGGIGHFEDGIEALIRAICTTVAPGGTIIMMSDTRSFARTGTFSMDQPSETGLITEKFRQMKDVRRSCVPMVSFCAWGSRAPEYTQKYNSHLDGTSTIARLLENDGKVMLLGIGYEKCTLYHLAEERHATSYNYYKEFNGVLLVDGKPREPISQRYYVRKDMSLKKDPGIAGEMLEAAGLAQTAPIGDSYVKVFRARDFDRCCMQALENDQEAFLVRSQNAKEVAEEISE